VSNQTVVNRAMKKITILLGIAFALLQIQGGLRAQDVSLPNDPLAGQKVFVNKGCVNCHALFGRGGGVGRDLGKTQADRGPAGIVAMMWNHSPEMNQVMQRPQEMPVFKESEMADIIAFIYFLNYLDQPGDAASGQRLVQEKKCLSCHKVGGAGGLIAPPLDKVKSFANPLSLAQRMWNHGIGMSSTMAARGIAVPNLEGADLVDIFAYLRETSSINNVESTFLIPGKPSVGRKLFEEKGCLNCHAVGDEGSDIGPDLTRSEFHMGVTQIAAKLWQHGPKMWEKMRELEIELPTFEGNEMADLVAYLYYLNFVNLTGDTVSGKAIFSRKGCIECHSIRGLGGNVAADLATSEHTANYIKAATAMWNHNRRMRQLMAKVGVAMPRFSENEMKDLLAYLRSERLKNE